MSRFRFLICDSCAEARNCKKPKHDLWQMKATCSYCNQEKTVYNLVQLHTPIDQWIERERAKKMKANKQD